MVRGGRRRSRGSPRLQPGQALAEFALVAVPLLLLLLGIVQFTYLYNAQVGLTNAVRDVARYGSALVANTNGTASASATLTRAFLQTSLSKYVAPFSSGQVGPGTQVCYAPYVDAAGASAVRVTVTAEYDHPLIVPIIGGIIDGLDGAMDGAFRITVSSDLRVDNPLQPIPNLSSAACVS